jgi:hypothetical protein
MTPNEKLIKFHSEKQRLLDRDPGIDAPLYNFAADVDHAVISKWDEEACGVIWDAIRCNLNDEKLYYRFRDLIEEIEAESRPRPKRRKGGCLIYM